MFELLDTDNDKLLEFQDLMVCLFSLSEDLSKEQILRRSYLMYDTNRSGKVSKAEMMKVLVKLGKIESVPAPEEATSGGGGKKDKVEKIPEEVEYVFGLMDFDGNENKVKEEEFLRAALHYRKLGGLLSIRLLETKRKNVVVNLKKSAYVENL